MLLSKEEKMKNLSLIAAMGKNHEIGLDNHLLWHIPEDLQFYKKMTWGKNVVVGRNTLFSMPAKAFEGRVAYVLSPDKLDVNFDVNSFDNMKALLDFIESREEEFMVIGGASMYLQFLPYVDTMYLTEIDENYEADTFFPEFDVNDFDVELMGEYSYNNINYSRNKYVRKKVNNG